MQHYTTSIQTFDAGKVQRWTGGKKKYTSNEGIEVMYMEFTWLGRCSDPNHGPLNEIRKGSYGYWSPTTKKCYCINHAPIFILAIQDNKSVEEYMAYINNSGCKAIIRAIQKDIDSATDQLEKDQLMLWQAGLKNENEGARQQYLAFRRKRNNQ